MKVLTFLSNFTYIIFIGNSLWAVLRSESEKLSKKLVGLEGNKHLHTIAETLSDVDEKLGLLVSDLSRKPHVPGSSDIAKSGLSWSEEVVLENIAVLERRLTGLEGLLGSSANVIEMESLRAAAAAGDKVLGIYPLSQTIARLEMRMNSVDEQYLDKVGYPTCFLSQ